MKRIMLPSKYTIAIVIILSLLFTTGTIGEIIPVAYAQSCNEEKNNCFANGGSWNATTKTCTYPPPPPPPPPPPDNPCATITQIIPIESYLSCYGGCISCWAFNMCCSQEIIVEYFGDGGVSCGQASMTSSFSCGTYSWEVLPDACSYMCDGTACYTGCTITVNGQVIPCW